MDGISFDSLTYLPDDSFVIECNDDFGGICEDIVRLASASHLVDQLNPSTLASGNESPPSSCYYSSGRYFDKEVPSLFSEMEYLTEVSPETEMAIVPSNQAPLAVDPIEFSWKRKEEKTDEESKSKTDEETQSPIEEAPKEVKNADERYFVSTNYKKILQNYIRKGKRKLEESASAKMKATVVSVTAGTNSTSLIETVTCASYVSPQYSTGDSLRNSENQITSEPAHLPNYRCHDCNSSFLSVERLKKHTCIIAEQYQCQLCRREFRKRKTLEQHIKSHDKIHSPSHFPGILPTCGELALK